MRYYVVSDLHVGMGKDETGALHPLEDFDCNEQFGAFLELVLEHKGDLIINGDWVDFLQIEPLPAVGGHQSPDGIPLGWNVHDSMRRLATCLDKNREHFRQLAKYLERGGTLTVMQGNHDPEWFFPGDRNEYPLQKRLRNALGDPREDKLRFEAEPIRRGAAYIAHGHQHCEPMNAFQNHPRIFHSDKSNPLGLTDLRVELLWGSRFVLEFFNIIERKLPFADNLKTTTRALILGVKNKWITGRDAARLVVFMHGAGVPFSDVAELLDASEQSAVKLLEDIPDPQVRSLLLDRYHTDRRFHDEFDREVQAVEFKMVPADRIKIRSDFGLEEIQAPGGETLGVVRPRREFREAARLLGQDGIEAVLFGHTHQELDGHALDAEVNGYFNTGTWIPRFDLRDAKNRARLKNADFPLEVLGDRSLFELKLHYVEIQVEAERTRVELKEFK